MQEDIILGMVKPYLKDKTITYTEFDGLFSMLELREQYQVTNILYKYGICIIPEDDEDGDNEIDINNSQDKFEPLYDNNIFSQDGLDDVINDSVHLKQSNVILCRFAKDGDINAKKALCMKNKHLVDKYVNYYNKSFGNDLDFEDLEQVGMMGLLKAAQRFDAQKDTAFSTYAVWWIKQSIMREIFDHGFRVRVPVHMMEKIFKISAIDSKLEGYNINDRIQLISRETGFTEENVMDCLVIKNNYLSPVSLDTPVGEEEETPMLEMIPDDYPSVEETVDKKALAETIHKVIKTLTPREERILYLRFGLIDGRERTLEEIGKELKVTRERIRQIENKALRKLRHPSRSKMLKDFLE